MVQENSITKVAFTGNTDLTFKCIKAILSESIHVSAIFGLSDAKLKGKTNHINLVDFVSLMVLNFSHLKIGKSSSLSV